YRARLPVAVKSSHKCSGSGGICLAARAASPPPYSQRSKPGSASHAARSRSGGQGTQRPGVKSGRAASSSVNIGGLLLFGVGVPVGVAAQLAQVAARAHPLDFFEYL